MPIKPKEKGEGEILRIKLLKKIPDWRENKSKNVRARCKRQPLAQDLIWQITLSTSQDLGYKSEMIHPLSPSLSVDNKLSTFYFHNLLKFFLISLHFFDFYKILINFLLPLPLALVHLKWKKLKRKILSLLIISINHLNLYSFFPFPRRLKHNFLFNGILLAVDSDKWYSDSCGSKVWR